MRNGSALLLPIQNSSSGVVRNHLNVLKDPSTKVIADINHQVRVCLCGIQGVELSKADTVLSHHQAIKQCSNIVGTSTINLTTPVARVTTPGALKTITTHKKSDSTAAGLAQIAAKKLPNTLGLGTRECAEFYGLQVLNDNASNNPAPYNITQMLLVQTVDSTQTFEPDLPHHTLVIPLYPTREALYSLLHTIAQTGTNITSFQKRTTQSTHKDIQCLLELDTKGATNCADLPRKIQALPGVKQGPVWHPEWRSWSDKVGEDLIEPLQYEPINWAMQHTQIKENALEHTITVTPKNAPGSLLTVTTAFMQTGLSIATYNVKTIGHKTFAFTFTIASTNNDDLHKAYEQLEQSGCLLAIRYT